MTSSESELRGMLLASDPWIALGNPWHYALVHVDSNNKRWMRPVIAILR